MAAYTRKVPLTFKQGRGNQTWNFDFVSVHLVSSSVGIKSIPSLQILNIANDCSANLLHSYMFWASCELRVESYSLKTVPKSFCLLMCTLPNFSSNNCVGMACIVRPHLGYWVRAVQWAVQAGRSCKEKFVCRFVYQLSAYWKAD